MAGLLLALALTCASAGAFAGDAAGNDATKRILVTFADPGMGKAARPGPSRPAYTRRSSPYLVSMGVKRSARRIAREFGMTVVDEWPIVPLKVHCLVFSVSADASVEDLLTRLRARPEVESAQLLNLFEVSGSLRAELRDPYAGLQHNLHTLDVERAHAWSLGDGVSVTIIDTGADLEHPELKARIRHHRDFVGADGRAFSADPHGTAIAGIIGASSYNGIGIVGVAPSARVDVLKACWYAADRSRAICDSFTLAKALSHAVDSDTQVINLSLGGPPDPLLARLVDIALERGIVVVAAAPNSATPGFPADVAGVIVVARDDRSEADGPRAAMSIAAPGNEILVPVPGGGFDYASGSSLSAAHVSGIVALLFASQPRLTHEDITSLLADSRAPAGKSVNACRALASLLRVSGCEIDSASSPSL